MNDPLEQLTELLRKLPGIGPRQSRRLAFWFVRQRPSFIKEFSEALTNSRDSIHTCDSCKRLYPKQNGAVCKLCTNEARDGSVLMLVERDVDLENIEKTGSYRGKYFVLGGTTSPLDKEPNKKIRMSDLTKRLQDKNDTTEELIFALSATTEGEDTIMYLESELKDIIKKQKLNVTKLGRGLSTGTELEYVDKETMSHALKGRS